MSPHSHPLTLSRLLGMVGTVVTVLFAMVTTTTTTGPGARVVSASPSVLRMGVFDWLSDYDGGARDGYSPDDGGYTASLTVNFIIAMKHFNERNVTILPDLATKLGPGCNKTVDIVRVCDTGGYEPFAFTNFLQLLTGVPPNLTMQAMLGPQRSSEALPISYAATVLGSIPIVSHWATSPRLANPDSTFFRTVPSDNAGAALVAELLQSLGYTKVAGLYESDDFGSGFKDALFSELADRGISLNAFGFALSDDSSLRDAIRGIAALELNIVVGIFINEEIPDVAPLAAEYGLLSSNTLWVHCAIDSGESTISAIETFYPDNATATAQLVDMMHGSISLELHVDNPLFERYVNVWATEFDTSMTSLVNSKLPPNGDADDSTSCLNDAFSMQIWSNFFADTASLAFEEWAFAYDAVMALGIAMCATDPTGPVPSGEDLVANLRNVDFDGLSGRVRFLDTGDRDPLTIAYRITNYFRNDGDGSLNFTVAATWDGMQEKWVFNNDSVVFRTGKTMTNLPPQVNIPFEDRNYLPTWARALGYVEFAVLIVLTLLSAAWIEAHKQSRLVINAQGPMLQIVVLGCFIMCFSILTLTMDDADPTRDMGPVCMASPVLFSLGFELSLAALLAKTYRVHRLFHNPKFKRIRFSTGKVIAIVAIAMSFELVLVLCWIFIAPLHWERSITSVDKNSLPTASAGSCQGDATSGALAASIFVMQAVSLGISIYAGYQIRDVPTDFSESQYIALTILCIGQLYFVAVPAVVATYTYVIGRFIICTAFVMVTVLALLGFMVFPKILRFHGIIHSSSSTVEDDPGNNNNNNNKDGEVVRESRRFVNLVSGGFGSSSPSKHQSAPKTGNVTSGGMAVSSLNVQTGDA